MQPPLPAPSAPPRLALAWRQILWAGAALLLAPAFAAPQGATLIDPAAFVVTADGKPAVNTKTKGAAAKPGAGGAKATAGGKQSGKNSTKGSDKKAARQTVGKKKQKAEDTTPGPLADFGRVVAPPDVMHVANWVSHTRNHKKKSFVLIDKKKAQLYVFDPKGKLKSHTPILLGKAIGDHTVPGVGNKPMKQIKEDEKTTPAGRFLAQPGRNTKGEDIIWIDYNASVSMHRLRKVSAAEQRAQRMETEDASDNRISYGCVNVPPKFYNSVLKPTVTRHGAFVYVLPETRTPQQQFGSFDLAPEQARLAQVAEAAAKAGK